MFESIKHDWAHFRESEPGRRFQERYERQRHGREGRSTARRILHIGLGLVVMAVGVIMMPAPGPGWLVFFLGAGLISGESRPMARFLDRAEVFARKAGERARRFWARASLPVRALLGLVVLAAAGALAWGGYRLFLA